MKSADEQCSISSPAPTAFDRSRLAAVSGGKPAVERDIVTLFRRLNEEDMATLRDAVNEGDLEGVGDASHRILGSSRMIGATGMAAICERVSIASHGCDLRAVQRGMAELQQEVLRVYACLDEICGG